MAPEKLSAENRPRPGITIAQVYSLSNGGIQLKEVEGTLRTGGDDDDLTSLSWLVQDKNLLKGINLKPGPTQISATSDFAEETSSASDRSERGGSTCSFGSGCGAVQDVANSATPAIGSNGTGTKIKHPHHIPYDPLIHINSKPPYSFSCLIFMAIEDSPARALPVKEIYSWIQNHFPFYRNAPTGWKNSVRHNLSLNKCFRKVEKAPNLGKGSLWMVDPAFRPNLLQSMSKAPVNSLSFLERCNSSHSSSIASTKPNANPIKPSNVSSSKSLGNKLSRLPNPELFPFLSRRLAASGVDLTGIASGMGCSGGSLDDSDDEDEDDDAEDVHAAAAMLTLKHGPRLILPKPEFVYVRSQPVKFLRKLNPGRTRKPTPPVITSSPSEDHTYSAGPNLSPDEAYEEGSDTDDGTEITPDHFSSSNDPDADEQRRIAEGAADALLNLAGLRGKRNSCTDTNRARGRSRPMSLSDSGNNIYPNKRIRRQRKLSCSLESTPKQQLRTNRKREVVSAENEVLDRKSAVKAEIMADLEVIRNNNNHISAEAFKNGSSDFIKSSQLKSSVKSKRSIASDKKIVESHDTKPSIAFVVNDKLSSPQKRKHWSIAEQFPRKGRR